ncbi:MAG: PilT protein [Gammaproteobacteria bacterium]|jgi:putative PIN family toxin of toxin-antitoxin system|nr:PilT protein [Gammaproteobacteria bacterium]MCE3237127.1 PilT protein [Gammaproteobacteria bacterium]
MRVVLDTNILLSALISPHGTSDTIYRAWRAAKFTLITSTIQLDELRRASRYPKFKSILQPTRVGTMINNLQYAIVLKRLSQKVEADDPNDSFLLSMVIEGHADYLVTGDCYAGLLKRKKIGRTRILKPASFCLEVLKIQIN